MRPEDGTRDGADRGPGTDGRPGADGELDVVGALGADGGLGTDGGFGADGGFGRDGGHGTLGTHDDAPRATGGPGTAAGPPPVTTAPPASLAALAAALRRAWAADTCSPDDLERTGWSPDNPAWGHCDVTALIVHDAAGGDLVLGEVVRDGERQGYHWWNRLPDGTHLDLTRDQFRDGQRITGARVIPRPPGRPRRRAEAYDLLRARVYRTGGDSVRGDVRAAGLPGDETPGDVRATGG